MLTAYDHPTARILDAAGIPLLLVGDSVGQVMLGYETTVRVTMAEMVHHTKAVVRGSQRAIVIADMPFLSYSTPDEAIENAGIFLREAGAQAVKVEGGVRSARMIETLVRAGIPVMGHIGLTPQSINTVGKVRVQGKNREQARALIADAQAVQEAGAFAMVLELMPAQLAAAVTDRVRIPTIGIGAGAGCSGQVQVITDLIGLGDFIPRHARPYAQVGGRSWMPRSPMPRTSKPDVPRRRRVHPDGRGRPRRGPGPRTSRTGRAARSRSAASRSTATSSARPSAIDPDPPDPRRASRRPRHRRARRARPDDGLAARRPSRADRPGPCG